MTNQTKHTPGPWTAYNASNGRIYKFWRIKAGKHVVATVSDIDLTNEDYANARLIAAAPELLEALETLINLHEGVDDGGSGIEPEDWQTAKDVVSKALGH
jgi:hypothetical protein